MEDYNIDEFSENPNNEFNSRLQEWQERLMISSIETNFKKIKEHGIDEWYLKKMENVELIELQKTLKIMLEYYQGIEQYENCKIIFDNFQNVSKLTEKER